MALLASKARVAIRSSSTRMVAASSRVRSVVVRANEGAAPAAPAAEKKAWSEPTLNPDTPSPIFGGSTGGLLRKAQVCGGLLLAKACVGDPQGGVGRGLGSGAFQTQGSVMAWQMAVKHAGHRAWQAGCCASSKEPTLTRSQLSGLILRF